MPSFHPSFYALYNVLVGSQVTSHYYIPIPENEIRTANCTLLGLRVSRGAQWNFSNSDWERNQNLAEKTKKQKNPKKTRALMLEEIWENCLVPRGWSCDSLKKQYPKGIREPGLD